MYDLTQRETVLMQGKKLDVEPKHHFDVEPAKHDQDRAKAFDPSELPPEHQEAMKKMQDDAYRQQKNRLLSSAQEGMYWGGTQTGANKLMDSRRPHGGMLQSDAPVSRKHH